MKACPSCEAHDVYSSNRGGLNWYYVRCSMCGVQGPKRPTLALAIAEWDALPSRSEVEALLALVREVRMCPEWAKCEQWRDRATAALEEGSK